MPPRAMHRFDEDLDEQELDEGREEHRGAGLAGLPADGRSPTGLSFSGLGQRLVARLGEKPGFGVSLAAHGAFLLAFLVSFSSAPPLPDAVESIPVDMVTTSELNQIMKGEKTAKTVQPSHRAEKVADLAELRPQPPLAEAKKDVMPPPRPGKPQPEPGDSEKPPEQEAAKTPPVPPKPPERPVQPPPRPVQEAKVEPPPAPKPQAKAEPKSEAKPQPVQDDAEPLPAPRPKPEVHKPEPKPETKPVEKTAAKPHEDKHKFTPDAVAKLLEATTSNPESRKTAVKPVQKPKSGAEAATEPSKFNASDISRLLSAEAPQRKASTGKVLQQTASLGAPNASASKMSPSMWDRLDSLLQEQYKQCWNFIGLNKLHYIPEIHVQYSEDGALVGQPVLLNPPADPQMRGLAESALRAVRRCNPLKIPAQYQPYYDQWKGRIVRFDPEEML